MYPACPFYNDFALGECSVGIPYAPLSFSEHLLSSCRPAEDVASCCLLSLDAHISKFCIQVLDHSRKFKVKRCLDTSFLLELLRIGSSSVNDLRKRSEVSVYEKSNYNITTRFPHPYRLNFVGNVNEWTCK